MNLDTAPQSLSLPDYSARTIPRARVTGDFYFDLQHAALGMITEPAEIVDLLKRQMLYKQPIDKVKLRDEIGDSLWYACLGAHVLGMRFERSLWPADMTRVTWFGACMTLAKCSAKFGDLVVNMELAANPVRRALAEGPGLIEWSLNNLDVIAQLGGLTLEECAAYNLAKLLVRFPDGFNVEQAVNRNLAAEQAALSA